MAFISRLARRYTAQKWLDFVQHIKHKLSFLPRAWMLFFCLRDADTPKTVKVLLMGALAYLMVPWDVLPDTVPVIGWLDDVAVIAWTVRFAGTYIKPEHREKARLIFPFAARYGEYNEGNR